MYSLRLKCAADEVDLLSGDLWEAGTVGIREVEDGESVVLIAGFETNAACAELLKRFASRDPFWGREEATDWVAMTYEAWPPREIGQRIFLAPPWCADPTPPGRVRVIHNPGLACGTGEHPCTRLALAALEENAAGKSVVDIGTGSGLLAIAALRLGANWAVGIDTDEAALRAASENFRLNDLHGQLAAGSAECLRDACAAVIVANISGTVLVSIADDLSRIGQEQLILTGFSDCELPAIKKTFGEGDITSCGEWRCLRVQLS